MTKELYRGGAFVYHEWDTSDGIGLSAEQPLSERQESFREPTYGAGEKPAVNNDLKQIPRGLSVSPSRTSTRSPASPPPLSPVPANGPVAETEMSFVPMRDIDVSFDVSEGFTQPSAVSCLILPWCRLKVVRILLLGSSYHASALPPVRILVSLFTRLGCRGGTGLEPATYASVVRPTNVADMHAGTSAACDWPNSASEQPRQGLRATEVSKGLRCD